MNDVFRFSMKILTATHTHTHTDTHTHTHKVTKRTKKRIRNCSSGSALAIHIR